MRSDRVEGQSPVIVGVICDNFFKTSRSQSRRSLGRLVDLETPRARPYISTGRKANV